MAKENLKEKEKLQQEKVEERVSAVEMFFNENKKNNLELSGRHYGYRTADIVLSEILCPA